MTLCSSDSLSLLNIILSERIKYCCYKTFVRKTSDYNDKIITPTNDDIVIGFCIGRRRMNRQDLFKKIIPIFYKDKIISFIYDYMYEYSINDMVNIICNSLNISYQPITLTNINIKMFFVNTIVDCNNILLHTMTSLIDFFPRERNAISKRNNAKIVHISSSSDITIKTLHMDSVTLSNMLDIDYMTKYTLVNIKITNNNMIQYVIDSTSDFISSVSNIVSQHSNNLVTSMKHMRTIASDLFVQRFSRESSKKMAIVDPSHVDYYKSQGYSIILYESKYYMSTNKDMFIGLKSNRLPNSSMYKYIPAVYKRDHSKIPGTNTYNYLNNIFVTNRRNTSSHNLVRELGPWESSVAPNCVLNMLSGNDRSKCVRVGVPGSISNLYNATIPDHVFSLCKQELPQMSSDQIRDLWYQYDNWHHIKYLYRILEELLCINVMILDDMRDHVVLVGYKELFRYIWNSNGSRMIIFLRTRLSEYKIGYEIISYNRRSIIISDNNYLFNYCICNKLSSCARYSKIKDYNIDLQYLNYEGKCIGYISDGKFVTCYSAPVSAKYIDISSLSSALSEFLLDRQINTVLYNVDGFSNNGNSYDDVVIVSGNRYYRSDLLDNNYVPQVLLDNRYVINLVTDEKDIFGTISIIKYENNYRYYLLL